MESVHYFKWNIATYWGISQWFYTFSFDSQKKSQLPTFAWRFISYHSNDDNCTALGNFKMEDGYAKPVSAGPCGDESAPHVSAAGEHSCVSEEKGPTQILYMNSTAVLRGWKNE